MEIERLRGRIDRLRSLPTFGWAVGRVLAALDQPDGSHVAAAALIARDQALTAQLLRIANSAFYARSGRVASALEALTLLGTVTARSVILGAAIFEHRELQGLWEHSLRTAEAAGAMASHQRLSRPEEVAGAGLLHDLGKVLLFRAAPDVYAAVQARIRSRACASREAEQVLLGADHAEVAGWLLPRWRLPARLVEAIVHHHAPACAADAAFEAFVVHCADSLAHGLGRNASARYIPPIDIAAARRLGFSAPKLDAMLAAGLATQHAENA